MRSPQVTRLAGSRARQSAGYGFASVLRWLLIRARRHQSGQFPASRVKLIQVHQGHGLAALTLPPPGRQSRERLVRPVPPSPVCLVWADGCCQTIGPFSLRAKPWTWNVVAVLSANAVATRGEVPDGLNFDASDLNKGLEQHTHELKSFEQAYAARSSLAPESQ